MSLKSKISALWIIVASLIGLAGASMSFGVCAADRPVRFSEAIISGLNGGQAQDVIIELDVTEIEAEVARHRDPNRPDIDTPETLALKATRFNALKQGISSTLDMSDIAVLKDYSHLPMVAMKLRSMGALNRLLARKEITAIHENKAYKHMLAESLPVIGQPSAATAGHTGAGTTIAVLDTGADYTRAAFGSCSAPGGSCKVVYAADFTLYNDGVLDDNGHGTNVAGIVLGVAPSAKIAALDVFDGSLAWSTDIISAINWSIANKATYNIVGMNLSLGGGGPYSTQCTGDVFASPLSNARNAGILPVVAAGNEAFTTGLASPACVPAAVSVGATYDANLGSLTWGGGLCTDSSTAVDKVACFSNSASYLTLLAPGALITAAGLTMGGTSQAAPHVAGSVAVLRGAYPADSLDKTVSRMTSAGIPVTDSRNGLTKPRLDLKASVAPLPTAASALVPIRMLLLLD